MGKEKDTPAAPPRHRNEQGPEDLLHLLILPERIDRRIGIREDRRNCDKTSPSEPSKV